MIWLMDNLLSKSSLFKVILFRSHHVKAQGHIIYSHKQKGKGKLVEK